MKKRGAFSHGLDALSACIHQAFDPHLLINMTRLACMGEPWTSHTCHMLSQSRKVASYLQYLLFLPWALEHPSVQWVLNHPEGLEAKCTSGQILPTALPDSVLTGCPQPTLPYSPRTDVSLGDCIMGHLPQLGR